MPGPDADPIRAALAPLQPTAAWLLNNSALFIAYAQPNGDDDPVEQRAIDLWQHGRVLVVLLPPAAGQLADAPPALTTLIATPGYCRVCGCSDANACDDGVQPCRWVEPDLCSACVGAARAAP